MNNKLQSRSNGIVQQINNLDNVSILELDKEEIISLFKSNGILLFRGFDVDVDIFKEFTNLLSIDFINYAGGAFSRRVINGDQTLLSVNDFKSEIKLHGEMYYQYNIPLMLWFFCANPPSKDGETTVCDGRQFFNEISSSTKELFSKKKLKFSVRISQEDWQKNIKQII
jgi:alpha-ketoglutarate-dependent taurine dioxygenase